MDALAQSGSTPRKGSGRKPAELSLFERGASPRGAPGPPAPARAARAPAALAGVGRARGVVQARQQLQRHAPRLRPRRRGSAALAGVGRAAGVVQARQQRERQDLDVQVGVQLDDAVAVVHAQQLPRLPALLARQDFDRVLLGGRQPREIRAGLRRARCSRDQVSRRPLCRPGRAQTL